MKNTVLEVPLAVDLSPNKIDAPVPLYNFLVWLIFGCTDEYSNISIVERTQSSEECHCHVIAGSYALYNTWSNPNLQAPGLAFNCTPPDEKSASC